MAEIAMHQREDWRELRHEPMTSAVIGRRLSKLAEALRDALEQRRPAPMSRSEALLGALMSRTHQASNRVVAAAESGTGQATEPSPQERAAPAAKAEPPRRVVSQLHRGDHATITEAIKAAKPGTVIMVEPGLYREGLVIDKPLEIIGQGVQWMRS